MAGSTNADCANYFRDMVSKKMREMNKSKSNINNPHLRTCVTHPIHKQYFDDAFVNNNLLQEKEKKLSSKTVKKYEVKYFHRLCNIFESNTLETVWGYIVSLSMDVHKQELYSDTRRKQLLCH